MDTSYHPQSYWEKRLEKDFNLNGVGYIGLGRSYNRWMYKIRERVFLKMVTRLPVSFDSTRVLDIGPGTGFYVALWRQLGVRELTGADITAVVVNNLTARYPGYRFVQSDIGEENSTWKSFAEKFNIVSAFDILYHIVDDSKYDCAIRNIYRMLLPGGYFIFTDNFLRYGLDAGVSQVSRSREFIEQLLRDTGFQILKRRPVFYLMNAPVDSRNRFLKSFWEFQKNTCYRGERYGYWLGAVLYPFESALLQLVQEGPSTEIVICRK